MHEHINEIIYVKRHHITYYLNTKSLRKKMFSHKNIIFYTKLNYLIFVLLKNRNFELNDVHDKLILLIC